MIGALPPLKGNAYYCASLAKELSKTIDVEFVSFRKLYPEFLYPGGVVDSDPEFRIEETETLSIHCLISYYNPFSWIRAGLSASNQIVHLQWWSIPLAPIYLVILFILKLRKKTIIFTIHNIVPHEKNMLDKILTRLVLRFGEKFFVHSDDNAKTLIRQFGFKSNQIIVIPMPVHDMYGDRLTNIDAAKHNLGIPPDSRVLLCFGNIRPYKGIDDLIRAFRLVLEHEPKAHLLIAGQPWESWDRYQNLIDNLDLQSNVHTFLEYIPTSAVKYYFSSAEIVVLPYKHFDAQSGVGNIALAFGLPLIVTSVGGLTDLVRNDAAIVKPNDSVGMAAAIKTILGDEMLANSLSNDAEMLAKYYSWEAFGQKTVACYRDSL